MDESTKIKPPEAAPHAPLAYTCPFGVFTSGQIIALKGELPPIGVVIQHDRSPVTTPHGKGTAKLKANKSKPKRSRLKPQG